MALTWLDEPTVDALRAALRKVAPDLAGGTIVPRGLEPSDDPQWCAASAEVDGRFVVKFAWARPPALRIWHQVRLLEALRVAAPWLPLPMVVTASRNPAMLVTRRAAAMPFFDVRHLISSADRPMVGGDLAAVLAGLHDPEVLKAVSEALGPLPEPMAPVSTDTLRARFGALIRSDQRDRVLTWCDWADRALATAGRAVLVHGDFHGDNHLWDRESLRLRLVIDWETAGAGEPEFDLRCLPGDCGIELFTATVAQYERMSGTTLNVDRIMAWHLRTVLGDALWRAEAGVALPDHRTPAQWVDDLEARFLEYRKHDDDRIGDGGFGSSAGRQPQSRDR
jgi:aminoglycoside phosphotransferase (APT) family kinase protein